MLQLKKFKCRVDTQIRRRFPFPQPYRLLHCDTIVADFLSHSRLSFFGQNSRLQVLVSLTLFIPYHLLVLLATTVISISQRQTDKRFTSLTSRTEIGFVGRSRQRKTSPSAG